MILAVWLCGLFFLGVILMFWLTKILPGMQQLPWSGSTPLPNVSQFTSNGYGRGESRLLAATLRSTAT